LVRYGLSHVIAESEYGGSLCQELGVGRVDSVGRRDYGLHQGFAGGFDRSQGSGLLSDGVGVQVPDSRITEEIRRAP